MREARQQKDSKDLNGNVICTYQTSREDFCAIEDTLNGVSSTAEQLKKVKVELRPQLGCLNFVLQLPVLPKLSVHRSIRRLEDSMNVELCLVRLSNEEQKGDGRWALLVVAERSSSRSNFTGSYVEYFFT